MNVGYNDNIPYPNDDASDDQPLLQENTNSIRSILEVDHFGFNSNNGGYHKTIRQPFVVNTPNVILNVSQLFGKSIRTDSKTSTTETQLFFESGPASGSSNISQMTGFANGPNAKIGIKQEGYQWLGGILVQWGIITRGKLNGGSSGGAILGSFSAADSLAFKNRDTGMIPFPNNLFNVFTSPFLYTSPTAPVLASELVNITIVYAESKKKFNQNGFSWTTTSFLKNLAGFYWFAIGN